MLGQLVVVGYEVVAVLEDVANGLDEARISLSGLSDLVGGGEWRSALNHTVKR